MPNSVDDVGRLEVGLCATRVNEPARVEAIFLEEDQRDSPLAFANQRAATAAMSAARGGSLSSANTRHAPVREPELGCRGERLVVGPALHGEKGLGTGIGGADDMEPQRHLAIAERVGLAFAETQRAFFDRLLAATTLGAAARGRFDDVCHPQII